MTKLHASVIPWSSIVGTGVILSDGHIMVAQLAIINQPARLPPEERRAQAMLIAQGVADAINKAEAEA